MHGVIVVSGADNAGKTAFSKALCSEARLDYCNVGDLLAEWLEKHDVLPADRRQIGPIFLREFGVTSYCDILVQHAQDGTVFDGVRLRAGVLALRRTVTVLHLFKVGPPRGRPAEDFKADLPSLRQDADLTIPWYEDRKDLKPSSAVLGLVASQQ